MKDAYYFSHDSNAKDDPKCMLLIDQLGLEGYGIFWVLVEILRDQPDYKYRFDMIPILARRYNTTAEKMTTVVLKYHLFEIDEQNNFFSLSLIRRMEPLENIREKRRIAGIKSGEVRRLNMCSTSVQQEMNKNEQSKVKESKVDNNIKTWKNDFETYKNECLIECRKLYNDKEFIAEQSHLNPNVNVKLSIEKAIKNYWETEAAWDKKRKDKKLQKINWKSTMKNAISSPMNRTYLTKQEQEPKPMEVLHIDDPIFNKNKPY